MPFLLKALICPKLLFVFHSGLFYSHISVGCVALSETFVHPWQLLSNFVTMISPVNSHDHHGRHTISAAYACFLDSELGSLSPGKLADFVILSTSTLDDLAEGSVTVEATYVAGVQAYPWKCIASYRRQRTFLSRRDLVN